MKNFSWALGLVVVIGGIFLPVLKASPTEGMTQTLIRYGDKLFETTDWSHCIDTVELKPNSYSPFYMDEWHTRKLSNKSARFVKIQNENRILLQWFSIGDSGTTLPFGITIGQSSLEGIRNTLGNPTKESNGDLIFESPDAGNLENVSFKFSKGVLIEVTWFFDVD